MFDNYYIDHKTFNMITIIFFLSKSNSATEVASLLTEMKY